MVCKRKVPYITLDFSFQLQFTKVTTSNPCPPLQLIRYENSCMHHSRVVMVYCVLCNENWIRNTNNTQVVSLTLLYGQVEES